MNGTKADIKSMDLCVPYMCCKQANRQVSHNPMIETECFDATVYDKSLSKKADVVLADVPCSGLGVLGRKRDIKYNLTKEMLVELPGMDALSSRRCTDIHNKAAFFYPGTLYTKHGVHLSVLYSMPEYLAKMWLDDYGMGKTKKMLQAMALHRHPQ